MIYDTYVHVHKSMCPVPSLVATDFRKICWSNSTPFVRALVSNGFINLSLQDGSVYHCFLVSDYVFLEKCFGESDAENCLKDFLPVIFSMGVRWSRSYALYWRLLLRDLKVSFCRLVWIYSSANISTEACTNTSNPYTAVDVSSIPNYPTEFDYSILIGSC